MLTVRRDLLEPMYVYLDISNYYPTYYIKSSTLVLAGNIGFRAHRAWLVNILDYRQ